jgi:hypothetical protein
MRKTAVVVLAALALGGLLAASAPRAKRATRAHFDRVREGMSRAEVEEALGGPPGDYRTGPVTWDDGAPGRPAGTPVSSGLEGELEWSGDDGVISVRFFAGRTVSEKSLYPGRRVKVGPLRLLRWRLSRWWRSLGGEPEDELGGPAVRL